MARRLVAEGLTTKVTTAVAVGFAVVVAVVSLSHGTALLWAPFAGNPLGP